MNHKYKALIKQEMKSVRWVFVYFCMVFMAMLIMLFRHLNVRYQVFMERGIAMKDVRFDAFLNMINENYIAMVVAVVIGIVLLVNMQFKDYKSGETGRFLKQLPVRSEKHLLIKVGCGMLAYTVPFVLYVGGVYWLKHMNTAWITGVYDVTPLNELYHIVSSNKYIGEVLLTYYLIIVTGYLFFMLMQYLMMWTKVSLVVGGIITLVPYYLANTISTIKFFTGKNLESSNIEETLFLPWVYGNADKHVGNGFSSGFGLRINYINFIEIKIAILLVLSVTFLGLAYTLSKRFKIENIDILIPSKIMGAVFCVGVTVCSGLLPSFIGGNFMFAYDGGISIQLVVSSMICLLIGYVVSRKITKLGNKKRGCTGYEQI